MNIMHALHQLLNQPQHGGGPIIDAVPMRKQMQSMAKQPMQPDITYDPTGHIPYSARTPELAQLGNQYVANPTAPQFRGVDPAIFGFPADNSALHQLIHGGSPQGFPGAESMYTSPNMQQPMPPQLQGTDDPGFTPLQGSRNVPNIQSRSGRTPQIRF